MARLCIRIAPNDNPDDPKLDALRTKPGDVVWIAEDDHVFSHAELNNGQYKIVDVPGVPAEQLLHLMAPRTKDPRDPDSEVVLRRAVKLDHAALKARSSVLDIEAATRVKPITPAAGVK